MERLWSHLRNKLFAGALAAAPIVIIIWGAVWLEEYTKPLAQPFGFHFPGFGLLLALAAVYLIGLVVTSLLGRWFLSLADKAVRRVPGLNLVYQAWKDVLVTPVGKAGVYNQVVLVSHDEKWAQLGFSSGEPVPGKPSLLCVFLPEAPNPIVGHLVLVPREACQPLAVSVEDAFKFLLSTGNFVPAGLHGAKADELRKEP